MRPLALIVRAERLAIVRFPPDAPLPAWLFHHDARFFTLTRTAEELSVVCHEDDLPPAIEAEASKGWRAIQVRGPLPLDAVGVLAGLTRPLAEAGIPVFVMSTWDTDYVLVREPQLERAVAALRVEYEVLEG